MVYFCSYLVRSAPLSTASLVLFLQKATSSRSSYISETSVVGKVIDCTIGELPYRTLLVGIKRVLWISRTATPLTFADFTTNPSLDSKNISTGNEHCRLSTRSTIVNLG
jgi:hypothetical protein